MKYDGALESDNLQLYSWWSLFLKDVLAQNLFASAMLKLSCGINVLSYSGCQWISENTLSMWQENTLGTMHRHIWILIHI